ncbi:hypothetical protein APH_0197 [Anaplasma phagocytophilum str. HZ]|uniref:Uncharacterized protein n=1 Tax=Anaplasma phagocytophilum (strain HZ) TaxID=212042 RepID=Q2GLD1_ANAPZ|nr:hypothetical protein APH_0197 [Anaplasma phagocytophilum str. HZ]KJV59785.1 hypothetical protein APHWEB_0317 [Anaplasma phagocytophilum str. Webster]KJV82275.1 hypothetical protein APHHGE2_0426 [Anaplasma phagocytophilum str. HGE2]
MQSKAFLSSVLRALYPLRCGSGVKATYFLGVLAGLSFVFGNCFL